MNAPDAVAPDLSPAEVPDSTPLPPVALVLGGATGMLGQALVRAAEAKGWTVRALGREDGPVTSPDWLEAHIAELNPRYVFNAIAYTAVDDAEDHTDEAYTVNKSFPALLGRIVRGSPAHLIHYGTDFVFNGKKRAPYVEDDAADPLSVYGASKLAGEQALLAAAPDNACVLRSAWLFGPGRKNFVSTILRLAASSPRLTVVHDQVGSPTFTVDLAAMSLALAEAKATGVVHAVNGGQASWCELACEAVSLANADSLVQPITSEQWPQKARRPAYSVLDTGRLTQLTGIKPRPWPQALRDYIFQSFAAGAEAH